MLINAKVIKRIGGLGMKDNKTMLEIYKINEKASIEQDKLHNKFLKDRNITEQEYQEIWFRLRSKMLGV